MKKIISTTGFIVFWLLINTLSIASSPKMLQYSSKEYQTNLATTGSTPAPRIDWGGEQGKFQLAMQYTGVMIDENTGVVKWFKNMPLQKNRIKVIAKNSSGQVSAEFYINQIFEGVFRGAYNSDPRTSSVSGNSFTMAFTPLNKVFVQNNSTHGEGSWSITSQQKIIGRYSYDKRTYYAFEGTMSFKTDGTPFVMGYWKAESSSSWQGFYSIAFESHHLSESAPGAKPTNNTTIVKVPQTVINPAKNNTQTNGVGPSDFSYSGTKYGIGFYTTGNSGNARINWGKERGRFYAGRTYPGVRIDPNLGVIFWEKDMLLGDNYIDIIAENSAGKATVQVNLYHAFHGLFEGGYSNNPNVRNITAKGFSMLFYNDGTMQVENKIGNTKNNGDGNWKLTGKNIIEGSYTYRDGSKYIFQGTVTYSKTTNPTFTAFYKAVGQSDW
ncbi:MAG: hypothetical protein OEY34_00715, partial [Cyclobacteriaceae bacterium]|nr:hypothetical protein [Cyclobacteriaceae bacterium]